MNVEALRLISINVGRPRRVVWQDRKIVTAIFKEPVAGEVLLGEQNLEGDGQADRRFHGGRDKAVYAYPLEHYAYWQEQLGRDDLPWGAFGENLTVSGLLETEVRIGDRFRLGDVELEVTQPRTPCYKLGVRLNRPEVVRQLLESRRTGFYLRVLKTGRLRAGLAIERSFENIGALTIAEAMDLHASKRPDAARLRQALQIEALSDAWRSDFERKLQRCAG